MVVLSKGDEAVGGNLPFQEGTIIACTLPLVVEDLKSFLLNGVSDKELNQGVVVDVGQKRSLLAVQIVQLNHHLGSFQGEEGTLLDVEG